MSPTSPHPDGVVRFSGEHPRIVRPALSTVFVAPGSVTGGEFGLFECRIAPDSPGAVPHYHEGFSESFHVLDGQLAVRTGDTWTTAGAGDFVHVPRRGIHAFRPAGDVECRFLILFAPGAPRERYFAEMAELGARDVPPTTDEIDEVARRHDQINLR